MADDLNDTVTEDTPPVMYDEYSLYQTFVPGVDASSKYMRIVMYVLGYPGNLVAFLVWIKKPMLQSSGIYLATLALSDLIFLSLDLPFSLQTDWDIYPLNYPIICEGFTVIYMAAQNMSPLLTLAFTTERYIAIKFPLKRRIYCTVKRAICMSVCITLTSLALCGIQGYFWAYDTEYEECTRRVGTDDLWESWTWCTEMIMFLGIPVLILTLNLLVIGEIRKARKIARKLNRILFKTTITTALLLSVSTFFILTTLPVSIVYALYDSYPPGEDFQNIENDVTWQAHFRYYKARTIIYNIGRTHFFMNPYIYFMGGKKFRRAVINVLTCRKSQTSLRNRRRSDTTCTKLDSLYSSDIQ